MHDDKVNQLHDREQRRFITALERARGLETASLGGVVSQDANLELIPEAGLGGAEQSLLLKDLLHYLSEFIWHSPEVYARDARHKLIPPRLLSPTQWHATRQDTWKKLLPDDWQQQLLTIPMLNSSLLKVPTGGC